MKAYDSRTAALAALTTAALMAAACGTSESTEADASPGGDLDAADEADARDQQPLDAATDPDAAPDPDANLTVHAFVTVDGEEVVFDDVNAYDGSDTIQDRTISADVGSDCPLGADCTTLYVTFPRDAEPGYFSCDDALVGVQLSEGSDRYFSFGSDAAFCGFNLDVNDGENVAVSDLSAHLEADNNPLDSRDLSDGQMRGPYQ